MTRLPPSRLRSKWSAVFLLLLSAGCYPHPHVELKAPEPSAPLKEREAVYEALRIDSIEVHEMPQRTYGRSAQMASRARASKESSDNTKRATRDYAPEEVPPDGSVRRANLGDGTHVYHVADLTPLVEPGSAAAEALERSARRRQTAKILNYVGGGIMLGGASVIGLAGVAAAEPRDDSGIIMGLGIMIGGGIMLAGGIIHAAAGGVRGSAKSTDRVAFEQYNTGLALRLHVCADERVLVPCAVRLDPPDESTPADGTPDDGRAESE